jgi:transposase
MIGASEENTVGRRPCRNHSAALKAKVAVEAIRGERTLIEFSQVHVVHPNQVKQWHDQLLEAATRIFGDTGKSDTAPTIDVKDLHAKIGQLTLENDFLPGALGNAGLLARAKK